MGTRYLRGVVLFLCEEHLIFLNATRVNQQAAQKLPSTSLVLKVILPLLLLNPIHCCCCSLDFFWFP